MSEIEQLPEPWQKLFRDAQVKSQNDLAEKAQVSTATVNRIIRTGRTSPATVRTLAAVLTEGNPDPIWEAIGASRRDHGEFPIHQIAEDLRLLTDSQREALIALVRSMAYPEQKAGDRDAQQRSPASTSKAGAPGEVIEAEFGIEGPPIPADTAADDIEQESEGSRLRREQDEAAEQGAVDEESPEPGDDDGSEDS